MKRTIIVTKILSCGKIMIYDNKLHKELKTFLQHLSPRWGSFKNISPDGGVFEQKI